MKQSATELAVEIAETANVPREDFVSFTTWLSKRLESWSKTIIVGPSDVVSCAADLFGVTVDAILGRERIQPIQRARIACYIVMRDELKMSFPGIARATGNRDHTTVMSAIRLSAGLSQVDHEFAARLGDLRRIAKNGREVA